jgi:DNA adenine methylase
LLSSVPARRARYFEPFVGGGALFFELRPRSAILADINHRLIRTYRAVRDDVDGVIRLLRGYPNDAAFFNSMRDVDIDSRTDVEVAAWFIYLNRTGFNGLYRVNRSGQFNVPFGWYNRPTICDERTLRDCSTALTTARLIVGDFQHVVAGAKRADFVYFDPPYIPISRTASFTSYAANGFGHNDHIRLRDVALSLKRRGVSVLLSNSSSPVARKLYAHGFEAIEVSARRSVNCDGGGRGPVTELVVT